MMPQHVGEQSEEVMQVFREGEHPWGYRVWLAAKLALWAKDKWKMRGVSQDKDLTQDTDIFCLA